MALAKEKIYEPLNEDSAVVLVKDLGLFEKEILLECEEIGDGNLNLVFRIADRLNNKSVIIKQALPYAKVVGESWPLTLQRAQIEADALKIYHQHTPNLVPKVHYTNNDLAVTIMEDLSHLKITRSGLIEGESYPLLSGHIGEFLAKSLFYTSDYYLTPPAKKALAKKFYNPELCKITEDLVFTDPFFNSETNEFEEELTDDVQKLWNDLVLKLEAAKLKKSFLTEGEALIHGDLHTGSIFSSNEETKVIDPEFAFFGPIGFDIGQFFANLLFQIISDTGKEKIILDHISNTWNSFQTIYSDLWLSESHEKYTRVEGYLDYVLKKCLQDAIGFAGCELIRRTIGLAHVQDLDGIPSFDKRLQAKRNSLSLGREMIVHRADFQEISGFIDYLRTFQF
ncbi:S-methyl-5-thioribose kinase [Falsibacillus albus]|uniref:Methylthioribose kinase n=1 Tax=Falsibacillus albus TaxID=2478915 RepID=A0A3L7K4B0_9BACI|nr:S-methyl-5-thioribose kinase [Falsibacillus albus]RLQ97109.1 S-methyl-5-thioribose kinase [Falsibacillus albus]